jgi:hypothetical protein
MHQPTLNDVLYYVTVIDAGRTGFLLGPYDTHQQALENVERGRTLAQRANAWSHFYAFGTVNCAATRPIKTVFGK